MKTLPGFWHAAARMSGRVDFGPLLCAHFSKKSLAKLSLHQLLDGGLRPEDARTLLKTPSTESHIDWLTIEDPNYPLVLRQVPYAPPVLFYRGNLLRLKAPALAIVGARRCSVQGEAWATTFAKRAVQAGRVVVSGMAQGIDSAVHRVAQGLTIAVLGHGLKAPMSRVQQSKCQDILRQDGLVISEFLPHFPASRWTFPLRNRVIAGLSDATLVVEAGARSGSLITARYALDMGRDVWAVPGHPSQSFAQGCLQLLRDGAQLIGSVRDLEDAMGVGPLTQPSMSGIIKHLQEGMTLQELSERTGIPEVDVHIELSRAVMLGQIKRLPGNRFRRG